jgi:cytochrome c-type biogenesis protein
MLLAAGMVFGVDRRIQTALVDDLPAFQQLTFLEETLPVQRQLEQKLP